MTKPLRIVHLALIRFWSAIAWHTVTLGGALQRHGHEVTLLGACGSPLLDRAAEAGITVPADGALAYLRPWNWAGSVARIRRILKRTGCDVVFVHTGSGHYETHLARALLPTALVRVRADARCPRGHPGNLWLHRRGAERIAVSGEYMRSKHLGSWGLPSSKVVHLPPGIDVERIASAPEHERIAARQVLAGRYGLPADESWIGIIGRLSPVKGHETLLRSMALLASRRNRCRLWIVGGQGGVPPAALKKVAGDLGIEDRVVFTGLVDDPLMYAAALDVGVVCSLGSEAVSRSALEFMAVGVPVVATRVGILPEVIGEETQLVGPGDPRALATAIGHLLENADRAIQQGENGRQRARDRYDLHALAGRAEQIAREAIAERRRSRGRLTVQ